MNDIMPSATEAISRLEQSAGARQSSLFRADVASVAAELERLAGLPMCQYDCDGCRGDDDDYDYEMHLGECPGCGSLAQVFHGRFVNHDGVPVSVVHATNPMLDSWASSGICSGSGSIFSTEGV